MERDGVRAQEIVSLPRSFYERGTVDVARDLLGKVLVHGRTAGIIVETEAYLGGDDLASHSAAGITDRTRVIFGPGGHAYVYLSYGVHDCMNIVAERTGVPGCVLIRALEPIEGLDLMRVRRPGARNDRDLASGPGKLTRALGITRKHTGTDMTRGDLVVMASHDLARISDVAAPRFDVAVTPRIGITKCADLPLRFVIKGNRFVSR
jgi:DNA-3-methyladenine glycosylase